MCKDKIKVLKGIANGKAKSERSIKLKSLDKRLAKMKNDDLVVYILDDESKNNLCRHLVENQMDADIYDINYLNTKILVFFINIEIVKWIQKNWKKTKGNQGFLYEKVLHKKKKSKEWMELKI